MTQLTSLHTQLHCISLDRNLILFLSRCSYIRAHSWSYASPMTPRLVLGVDYTSNIARGASSMPRVLHLAV